MFQKLRLKLTLINVSIILVLFLMLIASAYWFAQINLNRHTRSLAQKLMTDIQAGKLTDWPPRRNIRDRAPEGPPGAGPAPVVPPLGPPDTPYGGPPGPNFFFVKTNPAGAITFQSSGQPLDSANLESLAALVLEQSVPEETLAFGQTSYFYLKAPLANETGTVILLHDFTQENDMLRSILTALLAVGAVCAVLSFGASFFMASRAMIPIKRAWQQQQDFLSDASHELRTPLTVIQTNLDIVRASPDETVASQDKWLENIQEESLCMQNLVNSLLFLARADSNHQPLAKQNICLSTALIQAVAPFEAVAIQKKIHLAVDAPPFIEVYGDEARLKQVIAILLDNGLRHTPPGGNMLLVLSHTGSKTILTITDTGEGIEAEHLDKIFNRFYQVDQSRQKGGSGLGLAIARWIVESHGGSITASSTPGAGTTFTVEIPGKSNT
ncbi:sensor histidine kinase [Sporomusa aerivorans]|uniref:sensor histidine kinase n=1 Tax=Sporomusa aerivorans TaxID=204936 RepID=UPI00352A9D44